MGAGQQGQLGQSFGDREQGGLGLFSEGTQLEGEGMGAAAAGSPGVATGRWKTVWAANQGESKVGRARGRAPP